MARISKSRPAEFKIHAPGAKRVSLAGSFNNWNTNKLPAKKDSQGNWKINIDLKPGKYEYKFLVDGTWTNDPHCTYCIPNSFGSQNCVVEIK